MQKLIYCAKCAVETPHDTAVERGDIIFTCSIDGCGRFLKFPSAITAEDLQLAVAAHKAANMGLEYVLTDEQAVAEVGMTEEQVNAALAAISSL
jgi:hypothetical protein